MKAFIFDPLWNTLVTPALTAKLEKSGIDPVVITQIAPINECKELFAGNDERILCIKPYYVNWKLSANDYKNIPNLKAILAGGTSLTWIDDSYANEHNIPICNIKNFSTEAVAEWAIMMMFNIARQIPLLIKNNFPLDFNQDYLTYQGMQLKGKTVGIIGLGNIGSAIALKCKSLGMNITYWSKTTRNNNYTYQDLPTLLKNSDIIFPTMAINDETKTLLNDDLLKTINRSAIVICIVRNILNEELLLEMVKNKQLFGFGFEAKSASFLSYEGNIWAAPAYAWDTNASMDNLMKLWVDNMIQASKDTFPNRINEH